MAVDLPFDFDADPFHQYLGMKVEETAADYACIRMTINETTPTGIDKSVNGGALATLLDITAVIAVAGNLREGTAPGGTADLQITYLRQAKGEWIDAKASVLKRGRNLCTVHVDIINDAGVLCATGRVLYALRPSN